MPTTLRSADDANTSPSDMMGILDLLKSQAAHFRTISKGKDEECADYTISLRVPGWAEVHVRNIYPHWNNYMEALRLCNPDNQTWRFDKMDLPPKMLNALKSLMTTRNIHRYWYLTIQMTLVLDFPTLKELLIYFVVHLRRTPLSNVSSYELVLHWGRSYIKQ